MLFHSSAKLVACLRKQTVTHANTQHTDTCTSKPAAVKVDVVIVMVEEVVVFVCPKNKCPHEPDSIKKAPGLHCRPQISVHWKICKANLFDD